MLSNDYSRLHAACLVTARQYDLPGIQARWLVMEEQREGSIASRPSPTSTRCLAHTNGLCSCPLAERELLICQRRCAAALAKRLASHTGQSPMRRAQSPLSTPSRPNSGHTDRSALCQKRSWRPMPRTCYPPIQ